MPRLLQHVAHIRGHFRRGAAGAELLDPAGVEVDGVEHRPQPFGDDAVEVPDTVRATRHQAQQAMAGQEPARGEILDLPAGDLLDPVRKLRGAFGRSRRAARLEDAGNRQG
jgi:hypothetical protein